MHESGGWAVRVPRAGSIEEKVERLRELEASTDPELVRDYNYRLDVSWIYHDSALEGVVYTPQELEAAFRHEPVVDSALAPIYDEIRQHKQTIDLIREMAAGKKLTINLEVIKRLYLTLAPEEAEVKGPLKYRKDIPLHRLYFHDISQPDKIPYRMRQLVQWIGSADSKRLTHPVRLAAKAQHQFLHIYPFPKHSGKVGRLLMNLMLLRAGYPPAIIHSTDRQRYYEALKSSADALAVLVNDALHNSVESAIRYFEREQGLRSPHEVG
jgi:Fic family protein